MVDALERNRVVSTSISSDLRSGETNGCLCMQHSSHVSPDLKSEDMAAGATVFFSGASTMNFHA